MQYNGYDAFVKGYRSAFLCTPEYCEEGYRFLLSQNTPHIEQNERIVFEDGDILDVQHVWFFRDETTRQAFIEQSAKIEPRSESDIRYTGEILGYPPMAIDFFLANRSGDWYKDSAGYEYHGITFAGHIDHQQAIAEWLWNNVPAPIKPVTVTYQKQTYTIEPVPVAI